MGRHLALHMQNTGGLAVLIEYSCHPGACMQGQLESEPMKSRGEGALLQLAVTVPGGFAEQWRSVKNPSSAAITAVREEEEESLRIQPQLLIQRIRPTLTPPSGDGHNAKLVASKHQLRNQRTVNLGNWLCASEGSSTGEYELLAKEESVFGLVTLKLLPHLSQSSNPQNHVIGQLNGNEQIRITAL
ncbi:hypothetical protein EYF80_031363 [Liparis tanakae]|uniref:Uncharacterized protein n=1 Tax=Liparis tanakae TaxID=230148 RepID=A0A4Z2H0I9_9TELE|nr:hypothetical protein EYF80_031363 [Liparis tanakae]